MAASLGPAAMGQSLFRQPVKAPTPPPANAFPGGTAVGPGVRRDAGGFKPGSGRSSRTGPSSGGEERCLAEAGEPDDDRAPKPKTFELHEIVYIIISETSSQSSEQVLDAKKDASLKAAVNKFPDIKQFFQANLNNTSSTNPIGAVDLTGNSAFKGDGKFTRNDKFTDRIAATVIDVKPNGILVLEARKSVGQDNEIRTLVLSGECRKQDVTDSNTILTSQLADLTIQAHAEGDSKDTASKGILTRLMEAIFNF